MTIQILPPDESAKRARERVAEWKRHREIDAAKLKANARKAKPELERTSKIDKREKSEHVPKIQNGGYLQQMALIRAAINGDTEIVKMLIEKGADVNARNYEGKTALIGATAQRHTECAKILIENGADVNARDHHDWTAIIWAASNGDEEIVRKLIEKGADVNIMNYEGMTALDRATSMRHSKIVKFLIEKGATK